MKRKKKNSKLTVDEVARIKWKKLTSGREALTEYERKVLEKYDFDGEKVVKTVKFEKMSLEENQKRIKAGKAPRIFRRVQNARDC